MTDHHGATEANLNGNASKDVGLPEEDIITESAVIDDLRLEDGDELVDEIGSPILAELSRLANSPDLLATQRTILAYQKGDAHLFRFLKMVLDVGELIISSDTDEVLKAFSFLREKITDKNDRCKEDKGRRNTGIKNIGVPSVPIADQKFAKRVKEDSAFLYKTLVNFYFPNVSGTMRTQYSRVVNWAHEKQEPNFVTWIAGSHEVTIGGVQMQKNGLYGAFLKINETAISRDDKADIKTDDEIGKAFDNTNRVLPVAVPEWLGERVDDFDEPFMMLGRVEGKEIKFINYVSTATSQIKSSIKAGRGDLFPSDLDYNTGIATIKMVDAIKNLVTFSGAPELIMWQDSDGQTYVMPLFDQWINDDQPNVKKVNRASHFAGVLTLFNAYDQIEGKIDMLEFPNSVDAEFDRESDIFSVGFITNQVAKLKEFRGDAGQSINWVDDDRCVLEFMGAQWVHSPNRRPKKQTDEDKKHKRTRQPAVAPYGYKYLLGCKFNEDGVTKYGEIIGNDIDFALARAVFKKWSECRKLHGLKERPDHITICVKNGEIGIWFENVIDDGITHYDNGNKLVKVGTVPVTPTLKGQWRVPTYQLTRVWNLMTGPWELVAPYHLDVIKYHPEENLDFQDALDVMEGEPDLPFGHMKNLCSTREVDDGLIKGTITVDGQEVQAVRRKCIPLVLRCGALWLYLFNETR